MLMGSAIILSPKVYPMLYMLHSIIYFFFLFLWFSVFAQRFYCTRWHSTCVLTLFYILSKMFYILGIMGMVQQTWLKVLQRLLQSFNLTIASYSFYLCSNELVSKDLVCVCAREKGFRGNAVGHCVPNHCVCSNCTLHQVYLFFNIGCT